MDKERCDVCKKKMMFITKECSECYLKGFDKEREKLRKDLKERINNPSGEISCSVDCINRIIDEIFEVKK